jgi:DNA-binding response OmpR family regulator
MVRLKIARVPSHVRNLPRILLVEDDRNSHWLLRKILMQAGFDVISAMTRDGGLDRVVGELDYVITDLRLPDGDGEEILRKVRSEGLAVRVVVTSAESDPERLRGVAELRPDLFMPKPINVPELIEWLDLRHSESPARGRQWRAASAN